MIAGILVGAKISFLKAENKFVSILQSKELEWRKNSEDATKNSLMRSRAVIGGQFSEQLAPFLPDFPFDPTEVRFVGKPVDFIAFKGLSSGVVSEIGFVEIKSGQSRLSAAELSVREAVQQGRVSFVEYRVPENLTRTI